jgi:precorrin-6B methylase 2
MATFKFDVTQLAEVYLSGELVIEAETREEALKIIENTNVNELEDMVENWEFGNGEPTGQIEIWDSNGELLK